MSGKRMLVIGNVRSGKTQILERLYQDCLDRDIPCLLLCGRRSGVAPADLVAMLAARCAFDRIRIENAVIIVDDLDAATDDRHDPASALYYALLPVLECRAGEYGKGRDLVDLGAVTIVATATTGGQDGNRVTLPGIAADVFTDAPLEVDQSRERNGHRELP